MKRWPTEPVAPRTPARKWESNWSVHLRVRQECQVAKCSDVSCEHPRRGHYELLPRGGPGVLNMGSCNLPHFLVGNRPAMVAERALSRSILIMSYST